MGRCSRSPYRSAWPCARRTTATWPPWCAAPTARCTRPSAPAATGSWPRTRPSPDALAAAAGGLLQCADAPPAPALRPALHDRPRGRLSVHRRRLPGAVRPGWRRAHRAAGIRRLPERRLPRHGRQWRRRARSGGAAARPPPHATLAGRVPGRPARAVPANGPQPRRLSQRAGDGAAAAVAVRRCRCVRQWRWAEAPPYGRIGRGDFATRAHAGLARCAAIPSQRCAIVRASPAGHLCMDPTHTVLSDTRRRAAVAFIFVTVLLDMLAFGIIIPVLPHLIEQLAGGGIAKAAWWVRVFSTVFAVVQFA